jgi:hypothetical protein
VKPRTLLVLLSLVLVLGAFIWFFERDLPGSDERVARGLKVLGGIEADEVSAVEVDLGSGTIRLESETRAPVSEGGPDAARDDADAAEDDEEPVAAERFLDRRWLLTEPLSAPADGAKVRGLVTDLAGLEKKETVADPDLVAMGLAPPRARLIVETRGSAVGDRRRVLEVGVQVPVSGDLLVRLEGGDEVYVVEGGLLDHLPTDVAGWRSPEVLPFTPREVRRVRVEVPETPAVVLGDRDDRKRVPAFRLLEPVDDVADPDETSALLAALEGLRVSRFLGSEPLPETVGAPIRLTVDGPEGRRPLRLDLHGGEDAIRARLGDEPVELSGSVDDLMALISRPASAWRSRQWTDLDIAEIDVVHLRPGRGGAGEEITLERGEVDWVRNGEEIRYAPVRGLLILLSAARADEVVGRAAARANGWTSGEPVWEIEIEPNAESGAAAETLHVYPPDDTGAVSVTRDDRDAVLRLPAEQWVDLEESLAEVQSEEAEL